MFSVGRVRRRCLRFPPPQTRPQSPPHTVALPQFSSSRITGCSWGYLTAQHLTPILFSEAEDRFSFSLSPLLRPAESTHRHPRTPSIYSGIHEATVGDMRGVRRRRKKEVTVAAWQFWKQAFPSLLCEGPKPYLA